ncbi:Cytochrome [Abeliophyllum distichum]|uniref:Cytochrome n=1 Tax=Abeliophyllum distichum TaxID=126358 RepID=A0ABD1TXU2_9LAMI
MGTRVVVFGSSPAVAAEILRTHDRELSARYAPKATPIEESDLKKYSLLWSTDCQNQWKSFRVLWKSELFSNKALDLQAEIRAKKVEEMVKFLSKKEGEIVQIGDIVFIAVYNTLGNICFSKDLIDFEDEKMGIDWRGIMWRFMECATTPIVADFFPFLDWLKLDPLGQKRKSKKCMDKMFQVWGDIIKQRRNVDDHNDVKREDFLDFMMANGFSDVQILYMLLEMLPAGAGTLIATTEWAMAELLKNKEAMAKLHQELEGEIMNTNFVKESQLSKLPYLNACIKETLRLHPPIAFLPHCANSTCEVMNYTIPKNSLVLVNLWAMGHDPMIWDDPFSFRPERFLNSNLEFKGQDFEFLPFGGGRRMCPGLPYAHRQVQLILASLIYYFKWYLQNDGDPWQIDMDEKYAVPLQMKKPLLLLPSRRC